MNLRECPTKHRQATNNPNHINATVQLQFLHTSIYQDIPCQNFKLQPIEKAKFITKRIIYENVESIVPSTNVQPFSDCSE